MYRIGTEFVLQVKESWGWMIVMIAQQNNLIKKRAKDLNRQFF